MNNTSLEKAYPLEDIACLQGLAGDIAGETLWGKSGRVLRQIALRFASNRQPFCVKTHPDLRQNGASFCVKSAPRFASNRDASNSSGHITRVGIIHL